MGCGGRERKTKRRRKKHPGQTQNTEGGGMAERQNSTVKTPEATVSLLLQGIQAFGDDFWHVIV